ncbi:MAG: hypothetical protein AD073_000318 [Mycoplasmataceae bacterium]|nr:MAG: hypothetical protein AD073_000318 [Mycoplasmataceae bacterium]
MNNIIEPIHPSEVVMEDFLIPLNMTIEQLAIAIKMPVSEVNNFLINKANFTTDFSARLSIYFKMNPKFFHSFQKEYELDLLEDSVRDLKNDKVMKTIKPFIYPKISYNNRLNL